ncbi:unnamed protein product [Cyclocybe aegerita]|uniref:Uncharacterized protein n=1 Tax=Cyclocybe aegerita TaxID=1973307 RepID=A0A8S0VQ84_CYCAE|nr:unnamed protein product [Cyclocybe aegerita]
MKFPLTSSSDNSQADCHYRRKQLSDIIFSRSSVFLVVSALACAGAISATSILDALTDTCKNALQGVLVPPHAECLNLGSFLSLAIVDKQVSSAGASLPSLTTLPRVALAAQDLETFGICISPAVILGYAQRFYPTVRQIECLKDNAENELCVPQTISNLETVVGKLGVDDLQWNNLLEKVRALFSSNISNIAGTNCIKAAFTITSKVFPSPQLLFQTNQTMGSCCEEGLTDGKLVEGISQTSVKTGVFALKTGTGYALKFIPVGTFFTMIITTFGRLAFLA